MNEISSVIDLFSCGVSDSDASAINGFNSEKIVNDSSTFDSFVHIFKVCSLIEYSLLDTMQAL